MTAFLESRSDRRSVGQGDDGATDGRPDDQTARLFRCNVGLLERSSANQGILEFAGRFRIR
jgi:hypothetical protein